MTKEKQLESDLSVIRDAEATTIMIWEQSKKPIPEQIEELPFEKEIQNIFGHVSKVGGCQITALTALVRELVSFQLKIGGLNPEKYTEFMQNKQQGFLSKARGKAVGQFVRMNGSDAPYLVVVKQTYSNKVLSGLGTVHQVQARDLIETDVKLSVIEDLFQKLSLLRTVFEKKSFIPVLKSYINALQE